MTLETYGKLPHLEIGPIADSIPGLHIDRALAAVGKRRHVTLRVPYYLLAPTTWLPCRPAERRSWPEWPAFGWSNLRSSSRVTSIRRFGRIRRTTTAHIPGSGRGSSAFASAKERLRPKSEAHGLAQLGPRGCRAIGRALGATRIDGRHDGDASNRMFRSDDKANLNSLFRGSALAFL